MFLRSIVCALAALLTVSSTLAAERCVVAKNKFIAVMLLTSQEDGKGERTQEHIELSLIDGALPIPRLFHIRDPKNSDNYSWRIPTTCMSAMKEKLTKNDIARVLALTKKQ